MNIVIEILAQIVDAIGGALSIPANIVLDIGSYLHNMAFIMQNRGNINDEE